MSKIVGVTVGTPLSLSRIKSEVEPVIEVHEKNKANPHGVTASQIGLGNVNNTSDMNKPVSTAQAAAIRTARNSLFIVGDTAPTNVPALWFNVSPGGAVNNVAMLSLDDDETGYDVHLQVGDEIYGVGNATVNQGATEGHYDFTVL